MSEEISRVKSNKRSSIKKKTIVRISLVILAIIIAIIIIVAIKIKIDVNRMILPAVTIDEEHNQDDLQTPGVLTPKEDFYILIMGLDYREAHTALLTDSLMVLHIIPQEATIKLLSIPRDLIVQNSRGQAVKINSLFSEGIGLAKRKVDENELMLIDELVQLGANKVDKAILSGAMSNTRSKIEEILDLQIDYSVLVHFNTIVSLVDAIGGIEIDVKRSMQYRPTNLYLEPGYQTLNGEQALGYARFREDDRGSRYYASDFERGVQQQEVIKALTEKITSWKSISKASKLLTIVSQNVQTDMDEQMMYTLMTQYYSLINRDSLVSITFPEHYSSNGDVILPEEQKLQLSQEFSSLDIP